MKIETVIEKLNAAESFLESKYVSKAIRKKRFESIKKSIMANYEKSKRGWACEDK